MVIVSSLIDHDNCKLDHIDLMHAFLPVPTQLTPHSVASRAFVAQSMPNSSNLLNFEVATILYFADIIFVNVHVVVRYLHLYYANHQFFKCCTLMEARVNLGLLVRECNYASKFHISYYCF